MVIVEQLCKCTKNPLNCTLPKGEFYGIWIKYLNKAILKIECKGDSSLFERKKVFNFRIYSW